MNYIEGCVERTARKDHECRGDGSSSQRHATDCHRRILKGERYVEYLGESHAYASGSRHSQVCADAFLTA